MMFALCCKNQCKAAVKDAKNPLVFLGGMLLHKIEFDGPCYPFDLTSALALLAPTPCEPQSLSHLFPEEPPAWQMLLIWQQQGLRTCGIRTTCTTMAKLAESFTENGMGFPLRMKLSMSRERIRLETSLQSWNG